MYRRVEIGWPRLVAFVFDGVCDRGMLPPSLQCVLEALTISRVGASVVRGRSGVLRDYPPVK